MGDGHWGLVLGGPIGSVREEMRSRPSARHSTVDPGQFAAPTISCPKTPKAWQQHHMVFVKRLVRTRLCTQCCWMWKADRKLKDENIVAVIDGFEFDHLPCVLRMRQPPEELVDFGRFLAAGEDTSPLPRSFGARPATAAQLWRISCCAGAEERLHSLNPLPSRPRLAPHSFIRTKSKMLRSKDINIIAKDLPSRRNRWSSWMFQATSCKAIDSLHHETVNPFRLPWGSCLKQPSSPPASPGCRASYFRTRRIPFSAGLQAVN